MGNVVSAAEVAATQIISPNDGFDQRAAKSHAFYGAGDIPQECPMHQKRARSECPVQHGSGDDINPLNMVILLTIQLLKVGYRFFFFWVDAARQPAAGSRPAVPTANGQTNLVDTQGGGERGREPLLGLSQPTGLTAPLKKCLKSTVFF